MTIERARTADLGALSAIDVLVVSRDRQDAILAESVAADGCLVARDGDALAGYLTWDRGFFHRPFVRLLVVSHAHRRKGVGRDLVRAAEREAGTFGELFISTEEVNAPMRALLRAAGYEPSGSVEHINAPGNAELIFYKRLGLTAVRAMVTPDRRAISGDG